MSVMKIVFLSNYYNHHQAALSEALYELTNGQYVFVQTMPIEEERVNMGWGCAELPSFVKCSYTSQQDYEECLKLINDADVVIIGSAPEKLIRQRIRAGKLVFRYSERIYKNRKNMLQMPLRAIKYHWNNAFSKNTYLLCASAYAAADYAKTRNFVGKTYKWGYFPKVKEYDDVKKLINDKQPVSILWVARLIDLKHPEIPVEIARRLKADGYSFSLNLIGNGILEEKLRKQIADAGLSDCVNMLGSMNPGQVREWMEKSKIFLFTSDFNEGWGAVLNEAMNSACAVVASHAIGAVPYLLQDGENGFIYKNGDTDDLYKKTKYLLDNPDVQASFGEKAYQTMCDIWNSENSAKRLLALCENLMHGGNGSLFDNGPCSRAQVLKNKYF